FPSVPIGFWGDTDGSRLRATYFERYANVWWHGDLATVTERGGLVVHGRSDAVLNPGGVRIGTAEIYRAIEPLPQITDAVVVGRPVSADVEIVLCVVLAPDVELDDELTARIKDAIRSSTSPRHVPRRIFAVSEIPYTISGKKVEQAVRSMMVGDPVANRDALANPDALDQYAHLPF
ncbi:MAG: AMP-binding enzyme, partial [Pseudonocardiaceae bacterium]